MLSITDCDIPLIFKKISSVGNIAVMQISPIYRSTAKITI